MYRNLAENKMQEPHIKKRETFVYGIFSFADEAGKSLEGEGVVAVRKL